MKIEVQVKTGALTNQVEKITETSFKIRVKSRREKGKANDSVIETLASYFDIPKSRITILRGLSAPKKLIEVA